MKEREEVLLSNKEVLASVFVDPRFRCLLTTEQTVLAKETIKQLRLRLLKLSSTKQGAQAESSVQMLGNGSNVEFVDSTGEIDEFESFLQEKWKSSQGSTSQEAVSLNAQLLAAVSALEEAIAMYEQTPPVSRSVDVFAWWEEKNWNGLFKAASTTALAIPVTQVSVERLFSGLRFILNCLRSNMSANMINSVMLVRVN